MKQRIKNLALVWCSCIGVLVIVISSLFLMPQPHAAAADNADMITRRTLLNALRVCYSDTYMQSSIDSSVYSADGFSELFLGKKASKKDKIIKVASGIGNNYNINQPESISCQEVFLGSKKMSGLLSVYNLGDKPQLEKLGFTFEKSGPNEGCLQASANVSMSGQSFTSKSDMICFAIDSNGNINSSHFPETKKGTDKESQDNWMNCPQLRIVNGEYVQLYCRDSNSASNATSFANKSINTLKDEMQGVLNNWKGTFVSPYVEDNGITIGYAGQTASIVYQDSSIGTYKRGTADAALNKLVGGSGPAKFDKEDKAYILDQYYQYAKSNNLITQGPQGYPAYDTAASYDPSGFPYVYKDSSGAFWPVSILQSGSQYNVVGANNAELVTVSLEEMLKQITDLNRNGPSLLATCTKAAQDRLDEYNAMWQANNDPDGKYLKAAEKISIMIHAKKLLTDDGLGCAGLPNVDGTVDDAVGPITPGAPENPNPDGDNGGEEPTCYNSVQGLSWIICPVMETLASATENMYTKVVAPNMEIQAAMISNETREAWAKFRDFANLAFIIVFLIVIFSQVTGFGLDNYNIKKMLPKLVVVVILVNISFILCQILIDLSNIVGEGAYSLLNGLADGITVNGVPGDIGQLAAIIGGWGVDLGIGAAGLAFIWLNRSMWVTPILLFLITALLGIIFFMIMLGVRKAGIIILTVIAPIAIVCYALPNTKNLFDRLRKMFTSLLLLYPICGLLMGGGKLASKLMLKVAGSMNDAGFFFVLVAMLVQVVPFFFIPTLVKSSMVAMGNLGNRMLGLRDRLANNARGAVRNSETLKDWQQRRAGAEAARRAERFNSNRDVRGRTGRALNWLADTRAARAINSATGGLAGRALTRVGINGNSILNSDARNRAHSRAINAAGAQMLAAQIAQQTAERGMQGIEDRQSAQLVKHFYDTYDNDIAFKADLDQQRAAYSDALDALDANPNSREAQARVRALHKIMSNNPKAQDRIKDVWNQKLYDEQQLARSQGRNAKLSDSLAFAGRSLLAEQGGFKSTDRGTAALAQAMAKGDGPEAFNGQFKVRDTRNSQGDITGHEYYNDEFSRSVAAGDAASLANANDRALDDLYQSISNGTMRADQLETVYRNASEALTSNNIQVKEDVENKLNDIRQAAFQQMATSSSLYDDQNRLFNLQADGLYHHRDRNGVNHIFKREDDGRMVEQGGTGETIAANKMVKASDRFKGNYGETYSGSIHSGDSYKVPHDDSPAPLTLESAGFARNQNGQFYRRGDPSFTPLTGQDLELAQEIQRRQIDARIRDMQRHQNGPGGNGGNGGAGGSGGGAGGSGGSGGSGP